MAAPQARSIHSQAYDSVEQRHRVHLAGNPAEVDGFYRARLRFDAILGRRIDLTDDQLLDGAYFLTQDPRRLPRVAALGAEDPLRGEVPITVWGRQPTLRACLYQMISTPISHGAGFEFSSIDGDDECARLIRIQSELGTTELERLGSPDQVADVLGELLRRAEVPAEEVLALLEGWRLWFEAEASGLIQVRRWGSDPSRCRPFDLSVSLAAEPVQALRAVVSSDLGLRLVDAVAERLMLEAPPTRSAIRQALQGHLQQEFGCDSLDQVQLSGEEALDYVQVVDWFDRLFSRAFAHQHGSSDFDGPVLANLPTIDGMPEDPRLVGRTYRELPMDAVHQRGLADLPDEDFVAWMLDARADLQHWWARDDSDLADVRALVRALERLRPRVEPPAPERSRGTRVLLIAGEAFAFETASTIVGAPLVVSALAETAFTSARVLLNRAALRRASSTASVTEYAERRA